MTGLATLSMSTAGSIKKASSATVTIVAPAIADGTVSDIEIQSSDNGQPTLLSYAVERRSAFQTVPDSNRQSTEIETDSTGSRCYVESTDDFPTGSCVMMLNGMPETDQSGERIILLVPISTDYP